MYDFSLAFGDGDELGELDGAAEVGAVVELPAIPPMMLAMMTTPAPMPRRVRVLCCMGGSFPCVLCAHQAEAELASTTPAQWSRRFAYRPILDKSRRASSSSATSRA